MSNQVLPLALADRGADKGWSSDVEEIETFAAPQPISKPRSSLASTHDAALRTAPAHVPQTAEGRALAGMDIDDESSSEGSPENSPGKRSTGASGFATTHVPTDLTRTW